MKPMSFHTTVSGCPVEAYVHFGEEARAGCGVIQIEEGATC